MKKVIRIVGVGLLAAAFLAAIIIGINSESSFEKEPVWDEATTIGNSDAKNHFIIYADLVCPYCIAFENATLEHEEEFEKYLEENDILYEVRLSDFLYEYGEARAFGSRHSALASYCAKKEGKFWNYYNLAVTRVWNDYFKILGKSAFTKLNSAGVDFWIDLGKEIGLNEDFENCVKNKESLGEVKENTERIVKQFKKYRDAGQNAGGMPYFVFNNYSPPGFDTSWGWDEVLMYFKEGLKSKK